MTFDKLYLLPIVIILCLLIFFFGKRLYFNFVEWVSDHWFYGPKKRLNMSFFFYFLGLSLLLFSLVDVRGKPTKMKAQIPDQKTILMIDTSASMMAEDVRPNRFQKAIFLARHFAKKAIGHQVSVFVFSDTIKRLVPFTTDYDLLDSRLNGLETMDINRGGTNLGLAITEALQYLRTSDGGHAGNMLIFTDAEETEAGPLLDIGKGVSVAMVGVGTAQGAPVPMRDRQGVFIGNKQFDGDIITSKLDESFLKKLEDKIEYYRYWIATSYSLPTEEILEFFKKIHLGEHTENEVTIQEIYLEYILAPGIILLFISYALKFGKVFTPLLLFLTFSHLASAQAEEPQAEKNPYEPQILNLKEKIKKGEASKTDKLKLGEYFMRSNENEKAITAYEENLGKIEIENENDLKSYFNKGTTYLKAGKVEQGINEYQKLLDAMKGMNIEGMDEVKKLINQNTLTALKEQEQKQQKGDGESEDKKESQQNQSQDGQNGQQGDQQKQNEQKKPGEENKDEQGQKEEKKDNSDGKDGEKDKKDEGQGDKNEQQKKEAGEAGKKIPKDKLPTLLKQLVNDDRQLQEKLIDTSTADKRGMGPKKDW
ncbi:MAG: VWA domain-containing protein [Bacteriovoracaceae bacterium]|nr:VWA domain-containing protein [Bacteriovoracaceae bacterium]